MQKVTKSEAKKYFNGSQHSTRTIDGKLYKIVYYKYRGYADSWHYFSDWVLVENENPRIYIRKEK